MVDDQDNWSRTEIIKKNIFNKIWCRVSKTAIHCSHRTSSKLPPPANHPIKQYNTTKQKYTFFIPPPKKKNPPKQSIYFSWWIYISNYNISLPRELTTLRKENDCSGNTLEKKNGKITMGKKTKQRRARKKRSQKDTVIW